MPNAGADWPSDRKSRLFRRERIRESRLGHGTPTAYGLSALIWMADVWPSRRPMDINRNGPGPRDAPPQKRECNMIKVQRNGGESDSLNHGGNLPRSSCPWRSFEFLPWYVRTR